MAQAYAGEHGVPEAWRKFSETMFPFQKEQRAQTDQKMVEMMKKEAGKVLQFRPVETNLLASRARKLAMPDQYVQGLRKQIARGRRLK